MIVLLAAAAESAASFSSDAAAPFCARHCDANRSKKRHLSATPAHSSASAARISIVPRSSLFPANGSGLVVRNPAVETLVERRVPCRPAVPRSATRCSAAALVARGPIRTSRCGNCSKWVMNYYVATLHARLDHVVPVSNVFDANAADATALVTGVVLRVLTTSHSEQPCGRLYTASSPVGDSIFRQARRRRGLSSAGRACASSSALRTRAPGPTSTSQTTRRASHTSTRRAYGSDSGISTSSCRPRRRRWPGSLLASTRARADANVPIDLDGTRDCVPRRAKYPERPAVRAAGRAHSPQARRL